MWTKGKKIVVSIIVAVMALGLMTGVVLAANRSDNTAATGKGRSQSGSCDETSCGSGNNGSCGGSGGAGYRWEKIVDGGASAMHDEIARALGISPEEYQKEREGGKGCEEIAAAKGISAQQLAEIEIKVKSDLIDKAVADGKLTQEQAQLLKDRLNEKAEGGCDGACESKVK